MTNSKKIFLALSLSFLIVSPAVAEQESFRAKVVDVTDTYIRVEDEQGKRYTIDPSIETKDTSELNLGDRIIVGHIVREDGTDQYLIQEFIRAPWMIALFAAFFFVVIAINGKHGVRSIINVIATVAIVLFLIIPLIVKGYPPVLITIIGGMAAMTWSIYFSEGFNKKSHTAIISIGISLLLGAILSWIFVKKTSLTGFADESSAILASIGYEHIKMRGLLLAAIIIGALGVIDDVAISQASLVRELREANPRMRRKDLFQAALRVGRDHTSAVVNTLVLAYVGAAFPLVILISLGEPPFDSLSSILNNEIVATELVRALIGSMAIMMVMPISTWIALAFEKTNKNTPA